MRSLGCACLLAATGCTVLGPMPAVTGVHPVPAERPDGELQAGVVPGYYLSNTTQEAPEGAAIPQGSLMIEPGEAIGLPGFAIGARYVIGQSSDGYLEPMLRYRQFVDDDKRFAASFVAYGAYASGDERGASFTAVRAGLEATADVRITEESRWLELHAIVTLGALGLFADGHYCIDRNGRYGIDCPEPGSPPGPEVDPTLRSVFPTGAAGIALDVARHLESVFHGGRITLMGGGGTLPHMVGGVRDGTRFYASGGATATLAFGGL